MVFTDLVWGVEPAIQSLHVYVVLTAEGSSIGHDLPAVELEGDAVRGRSRPDGRLQPTDGPAVHAADAGDGAGEQALALLPRLSAELDDLAEDEGVLGQRAEHEQDARQQPYLKRRHLTRNRNSNPENELKHTFPVARISGSNWYFDEPLRDVVEGVDDDETEGDEEDDPGRDDVGWDEKGDPGHDDKDGGRQVDVEQVGGDAAADVDLEAVNGVIAWNYDDSGNAFSL
jgi:hypothetical protein